MRDERGSGAAAPVARRLRSGAVPAQRAWRLSQRWHFALTPMISVLGILFYLLTVALAAFALFWVIRLGVRFGLRDHAKWREAGTPGSPK